MRKKANFIIISILLLCMLTGCGNDSENQIIVETLPPASPIQQTIAETDAPIVADAPLEEEPEESIVPSEYSKLLNNFEFQDCLNMIISPSNPLQLTNSAPNGYAIGKPFRMVVVNNGVDGFSVEAGAIWQFPVIASGGQIIGTICAYYSENSAGEMEWKHFSATEGIAPELTQALSEYEAFALFTDGTDKTHSGVIYGITPKNKQFTIAQNSSELVALLELGDEETTESTEDPVLSQRISNVHKLRGERETQPFQTLQYHDVWGFDNTISTKLFNNLIYTSPDYTYDAPPEESLSEDETAELMDDGI